MAHWAGAADDTWTASAISSATIIHTNALLMEHLLSEEQRGELMQFHYTMFFPKLQIQLMTGSCHLCNTMGDYRFVAGV
jgi:hypothetical protein